MPASGWLWKLTLVVLALTLAAGCGDRTGRPRVEGQVTYQDKPVGNKTLTLVFDAPPKESFSQTLLLAEDGTFSGELPQPGKYKVVIAESLAAQERSRGKARSGAPSDVPAKYRTPATTDLTVTVQPGNNKLPIQLKD